MKKKRMKKEDVYSIVVEIYHNILIILSKNKRIISLLLSYY